MQIKRLFPQGERLPARNLLGRGLFCQPVDGPEHFLGTQAIGTPARDVPPGLKASRLLTWHHLCC
ncbi:MAG: hypothetical protein WAW52_11485 [Methanothrix sp.]